MANPATTCHDSAPQDAPIWSIVEDGTIWVLGSTDVSFVDRINNDLRGAIKISCLDNITGSFAASWTAR